MHSSKLKLILVIVAQDSEDTQETESMSLLLELIRMEDGEKTKNMFHLSHES